MSMSDCEGLKKWNCSDVIMHTIQWNKQLGT